MLVLSRAKNESLVIEDPRASGLIHVVVVEIRGDKVRLGIEAPIEVPVHRREVYDAITKINHSPQGSSPEVAAQPMVPPLTAASEKPPRKSVRRKPKAKPSELQQHLREIQKAVSQLEREVRAVSDEDRALTGQRQHLDRKVAVLTGRMKRFSIALASAKKR